MKNKVASEVTSVTSDIVDDQTFNQLSDEAVSQISLENAENEFNENDSDLVPSHFKLPSSN